MRDEHALRLRLRAAAGRDDRACRHDDSRSVLSAVSVPEPNEITVDGCEAKVHDALEPERLTERVLRRLDRRVVARTTPVVA